MNVNDLTYALIICLFGMGIVFLVLIGLSFITGGIKFFSNKGSKEDVSGTVQAVEGVQPLESRSSGLENETGEDELVAVIAAAVAAYMGRNNLVVRSIRRLESHTPEWGRTSRQEQMLNRL